MMAKTHHPRRFVHPVSTSSILRTVLRRLLKKPPLCVWVVVLLVGPMLLWKRSRTAASQWSDGVIESFEAGEGANFPPGKLSDGKRSYDSDSPALSDENTSEEVEHNFKLNTEKGYSTAGSHSSEEVTKPKAKGIAKALDVMSKFKSLSSPGWRAPSVKMNSERNREKKVQKDGKGGKTVRPPSQKHTQASVVPVKMPSKKDVRGLVHLEAGRMKIARQCDEAEQSGDKAQLQRCRMMKAYGDDAAQLMDATPEAIRTREQDTRDAILRGEQRVAEMVAKRKAAMGIVDVPVSNDHSNDDHSNDGISSDHSNDGIRSGENEREPLDGNLNSESDDTDSDVEEGGELNLANHHMEDAVGEGGEQVLGDVEDDLGEVAGDAGEVEDR